MTTSWHQVMPLTFERETGTGTLDGWPAADADCLTLLTDQDTGTWLVFGEQHVWLAQTFDPAQFVDALDVKLVVHIVPLDTAYLCVLQHDFFQHAYAANTHGHRKFVGVETWEWLASTAHGWAEASDATELVVYTPDAYDRSPAKLSAFIAGLATADSGNVRWELDFTPARTLDDTTNYAGPAAVGSYLTGMEVWALRTDDPPPTVPPLPVVGSGGIDGGPDDTRRTFA